MISREKRLEVIAKVRIELMPKYFPDGLPTDFLCGGGGHPVLNAFGVEVKAISQERIKALEASLTDKQDD